MILGKRAQNSFEESSKSFCMATLELNVSFPSKGYYEVWARAGTGSDWKNATYAYPWFGTLKATLTMLCQECGVAKMHKGVSSQAHVLYCESRKR